MKSSSAIFVGDIMYVAIGAAILIISAVIFSNFCIVFSLLFCCCFFRSCIIILSFPKIVGGLNKALQRVVVSTHQGALFTPREVHNVEICKCAIDCSAFRFSCRPAAV